MKLRNGKIITPETKTTTKIKIHNYESNSSVFAAYVRDKLLELEKMPLTVDGLPLELYKRKKMIVVDIYDYLVVNKHFVHSSFKFRRTVLNKLDELLAKKDFSKNEYEYYRNYFI